MIVVRALAPMTVMSDWITRSSLMLITPAGTLIVSAISLVASEAAIAARNVAQSFVVVLHVGRIGSPVPVTFQVSACAEAARVNEASPARHSAPTRRFTARH